MADKTVYNFGSKSRVAKTNQVTSYVTGDDGYYQKGMPTTPRFIDNGNGTVTDMVTGLMWVKNHTVAGLSEARNWAGAIAEAEALNFAGFTDWRLCNVNEMLSIVNWASSNPFLYSPFTVVDRICWTSTTLARGTDWAFAIWPADGECRINNKSGDGQFFVCRLG